MAFSFDHTFLYLQEWGRIIKNKYDEEKKENVNQLLDKKIVLKISHLNRKFLQEMKF